VRAHPRQGKRALLGGAIILLLLGLATAIFLLDDLIAHFQASYELVAVLPEAPRLVAGSRVWVGGNDVGEVRTVALLPAQPDTGATVALVVRLPGRVRNQVRQDSRVRITSVSLMGAPVVDITPGSAGAAVLRPGDTLRPRHRLAGAVVLARATALGAALDSALAELRALQPDVQRRLASLERVRGRLAAAQSEYRQLQRDLRASPLLAGVQSGDLSAALARSGHSLGSLLQALQQLQERARGHGLSTNTTALAARAAALQRSLGELQAALRAQGGTLDRLARDSALVRALAGARMELDSLLADARRRPLRYGF